MLQELNQVEFTRVGRNAYRADEVDSYVRETNARISKLMQEKDSLESKMIVLADKIEEYRAEEDSLRAAMLGAQRFGDQIVKDAKAKAESIQKEAEHKANEALSAMRTNVEREKTEMVRLQKENTRFRAALLALYEEQMKIVRRLPAVELPEDEKKEEAVAEDQIMTTPEEAAQETGALKEDQTVLEIAEETAE